MLRRSAVIVAMTVLAGAGCATALDEDALVSELVSDQGYSPAAARCIVELVSDQVDVDVLVGDEIASDAEQTSLTDATAQCSATAAPADASAVAVDEATVLGLAVTIEDMRIEAIAALVSDQAFGYSGRQAECVIDELIDRQGEQFLRDLATVLEDPDFHTAAETTLDLCG